LNEGARDRDAQLPYSSKPVEVGHDYAQHHLFNDKVILDRLSDLKGPDAFDLTNENNKGLMLSGNFPSIPDDFENKQSIYRSRRVYGEDTDKDELLHNRNKEKAYRLEQIGRNRNEVDDVQRVDELVTRIDKFSKARDKMGVRPEPRPEEDDDGLRDSLLDKINTVGGNRR
jgi:hypothetical protein